MCFVHSYLEGTIIAFFLTAYLLAHDYLYFVLLFSHGVVRLPNLIGNDFADHMQANKPMSQRNRSVWYFYVLLFLLIFSILCILSACVYIVSLLTPLCLFTIFSNPFLFQIFSAIWYAHGDEWTRLQNTRGVRWNMEGAK